MGPVNRYSIAAVATVTCLAAFLHPSTLVLAGLILLALATHLTVWNPERNEMFRDDWVEIGQDGAALVCGVVGIGLLVAGIVVALT